MRSRVTDAAGSCGSVEVAVLGAGLGDDLDRRARRRASVAANASPETRSSSTSPLIISVGGKLGEVVGVARARGSAASGASSTGPPR